MPVTKLLTIYFAGVVIVLVAWVLNVPGLYWMAGTLFLLPHAARLLARLEHRGLVVQREMPGGAHQGDIVDVRLKVRSVNPLPKLHLSIADDLPTGLSSLHPEPLTLYLPPRGTDQVEYALQVGRRGLHTLPGVRVLSTDLLGIWTLETRVPVVSEMLVYPRVVPLPSWALPERVGGGYSPLEISERQGEGSSFFGIREYRPGDPLRHVHWRSAARWGQLAVIEWEREESVDALLAIETREGTEIELGSGTTLDLAAGLAASIASIILSNGASLRLLAPGATEWRVAPERGMQSLPRILDVLARMKAVASSSAAAELRQVAPHLAPGTLIYWLSPVLNEAVLSTALYLRAARLQPVVYALEKALPGPGSARRRGPRQAAGDGASGGWEGMAAELESAEVPVVRVRSDDELALRLLQ
jgi:uncharacterized protein (DUF58 family)